MAETSLDRRFGQAHQRLDAHEDRLGGHDRRITQLEIDAATQAQRAANIDAQLSAIQAGITWITRLAIGGIIAGAVAFIIAGGAGCHLVSLAVTIPAARRGRITCIAG